MAENSMPEWTYPLSPVILADKAGYITLTNRDHLLDSKYIPNDLTDITMRCVSDIRGKGQLRKAAEQALCDMFDAAEQAGYKLYAKSVYRSYVTQKTMYSQRMEKVGRDDGVVAYPGSSDHQTGLGADVLNYEWTKKSGMNAQFGLTPDAQWMEAHCGEFGFVIRYMKDKENITGIIYEPWHLRYVGKAVAAYMMDQHLSLEEFDAQWHQYVSDWEASGGDFDALVQKMSEPSPVVVLETTEDGEEEISIFY